MACGEKQKAIKVRYDGGGVGDYLTDLAVEDSVLIELKAVRALDEIHAAQIHNYLKATI